MKALWFLIVAALVILGVARVSYNAGQREMREFDAECGSPGARCLIVLSPEYVETHTRITMPSNVTAAFFDDDGSLRGVVR